MYKLVACVRKLFRFDVSSRELKHLFSKRSFSEVWLFLHAAHVITRCARVVSMLKWATTFCRNFSFSVMDPSFFADFPDLCLRVPIWYQSDKDHQTVETILPFFGLDVAPGEDLNQIYLFDSHHRQSDGATACQFFDGTLDCLGWIPSWRWSLSPCHYKSQALPGGVLLHRPADFRCQTWINIYFLPMPDIIYATGVLHRDFMRLQADLIETRASWGDPWVHGTFNGMGRITWPIHGSSVSSTFAACRSYPWDWTRRSHLTVLLFLELFNLIWFFNFCAKPQLACHRAPIRIAATNFCSFSFWGFFAYRSIGVGMRYMVITCLNSDL